MEAANQTLTGILHSGNQYIVPMFQRYYTWQKENWEELWGDILGLVEAKDYNNRHFMGSLVFVPEPHYPHKVPAYQVIDGQQRLITLSLLLCALRNVAVDMDENELASEITENYLVHRFKKGKEHFRVSPRQRDRASYLNAIDSKNGNITGRIAECLSYFTEKIKEDTPSSLRQLFEFMTACLEFVHITLDRGKKDNPYRIFRSLNSTGVELDEGDLIRNFVFMHLPLEKQDEFDDKLWNRLEGHFLREDNTLNGQLFSNFFRDFLISSGSYVRPASTFQEFEERYESDDFDPYALTKQLLLCVKDYEIIRGTRKHESGELEAALRKLRALESSTTYPLSLRLLGNIRDNIITSEEATEVVELVSGFILRRYICQESSRAYGRWFASACSYVDSDDKGDALRVFLGSKGFPGDERFKSSLVTSAIYGSRYCSSILTMIEESYGHKERVDLSNMQIEHVMPQTLSQEWIEDLGDEAEIMHEVWVHTLGNLTLTGYNPELTNMSFNDKKLYYEDSNITMTREICKNPEWDADSIEKRAKKLARRAVQIWKGP